MIVERTNAPRVGDIVIAEVDGEWTMKYLRKRGDRLYLAPANPRYKPIVPKEELKVAAVVTPSCANTHADTEDHPYAAADPPLLCPCHPAY